MTDEICPKPKALDQASKAPKTLEAFSWIFYKVGQAFYESFIGFVL